MSSSSPPASTSSSPNQQLQWEARQGRHPNGHPQSPRQANGSPSGSQQSVRQSSNDRLSIRLDSPSRQLVLDMERLWHDDEKRFKKELDDAFEEQKGKHDAAIAASFAEHEKVREAADRARERLQMEIDAERQCRVEREKAKYEKVKCEAEAAKEAELAARKRQFEEDKKRDEKERQLDEQNRALEEEKRRYGAQKLEDADAKKRDIEEAKNLEEVAKAAAERKARETATAAERTKSQQQVQQAAPLANGELGAAVPSVTQPLPLTNGTSAPITALSGLVPTKAELESEHNRWLQLHHQLKKMRKDVDDFLGQAANKTMRMEVNAARRAATNTFGQLTSDKNQNLAPRAKIVQVLEECLHKYQTPPIDLSPYFITNPFIRADGDSQGPAVWLFLMNYVAKAAVYQLVREAMANPKAADHIMVHALHVFGNPKFFFQGRSAIDLLTAKFHKVCPVLFGIAGDETREKGRERIGWHRDGDGWLLEKAHMDRQNGLGAGWAALTVRGNMRDAGLLNPVPNAEYWKAISRIVGTPPAELQPTHFQVLKALIDNHIPRFIGMYGQAAVVALRRAMIELPRLVPQSAQAVALLNMAQSSLPTDLKLTL